MKKLLSLLAVLVIALFILSACKPSVDEGSFSVIDDSDTEDVIVDDADSGDVFEQLEGLDAEDVDIEHDLDTVIDEEPERTDRTEDVAGIVVADKEAAVDKGATKTEAGVFKVTVNEGELVKVELNAKDPDGDPLKFTYEKPLDSEGEWQTKMGDDGKYYTTVVVSDGANNVEIDVLIEVLSVNEDPVLEILDDINVEEGETIRLRPKASDADGDELKFTYSGWMMSDTKVAGYTDAGTHKVTVKVTDGMGGEDSQTITIVVKDVNRAPVIEGLQ